MRSYMLLVGLLFIALAHTSFAQKGAEHVVRVAEGAPLEVECLLRLEQQLKWSRDGAAPPADLLAAEAPRGAGMAARLRAPAARAHHAGLYSCSADPSVPRVRVLVLPATAPPASAAPPPPADEPPAQLYHFDVYRNISLNCSSGSDVGSMTYSWQKNDTALELVDDLAKRYELLEGGAVFFVRAHAREDDFGNYTCLLNGVPVARWRVHANPVTRLLPNTNVVEGQTLKITCKVIGKPYPVVEWGYARSEHENATDVQSVLGDRVVLSTSAAGVPQGELKLEKAETSDAGRYFCSAPGGAAAETVVRVKGMYAALWPFLGICAEVFVLCAIILVYEKRRTKPELDDSDTDNHEQKKS